MEHLPNPSLAGIGGLVEGSTFALADEEISICRDHANPLAINGRTSAWVWC